MVEPGASVLELAGVRPTALLDKDEIRERLSLALVCNELGITPDESGRALCPLHDDHTPSFELYEDQRGVEKWACRPCGEQGDVFDLLQRIQGIPFGTAVERARSILQELIDLGLTSSRRPAARRRTFDCSEALRLLSATYYNAVANAGWICVALGLAQEREPLCDRERWDDVIRDVWKVGIGSDLEGVFPHFDATGVLRGVKFRSRYGARWTLAGSEFTALYGAWIPRQHRAVLLCEGETDALWAAMQRQPVDVLALPSGAGRVLPEWAALEADIYFLAFDGDAAGDRASVQAATLWPDRDVRQLDVPRGHDLRSWAPDLGDALRSCDTMAG